MYQHPFVSKVFFYGTDAVVQILKYEGYNNNHGNDSAAEQHYMWQRYKKILVN